jgi:hypothetical protein
METEEQMIERVYRDMFGKDTPIPEDALELVKKTYREYMADLDHDRMNAQKQPTGDPRGECAA